MMSKRDVEDMSRYSNILQPQVLNCEQNLSLMLEDI